MLFQADQEAAKISGQGIQWQHNYGNPETSQLVNTASVWFLYYPASVITPPNQFVIATWALPQFWTPQRASGSNFCTPTRSNARAE